MALALTDHDTIDGIHAFMNAGKNFPGIVFLPGVELSASVSGGEHYHFVGLGLDPDNAVLGSLMARLRSYRRARNERMLEKLRSLGMDLGSAASELMADSVPVGRPHFASALVRAGHCRSMRQAFELYLGRGKPAFVGRRVPTAAECLTALRAAGALSIWAHPMTSNSMTGRKCRRIVDELLPHGLDGIEAYYPEHSRAQTIAVKKIARECALLLSGGTDFHGENIPGLHLGVGKGAPFQVPDALLPPILKRIAERRQQQSC
jgi:predicted metal-dependent phosphoesterase TrpH